MPEFKQSEQPIDRLTELARRAIDYIEADPDSRDNDKMFVLLRSPDGPKSGHYGIGVAGFEDQAELFAYLSIVLRTIGTTIGIQVVLVK